MIRDRDAVIVGGVRTPFARAGTDLAGFHPVDLGRTVVRELVERSEIDPRQVDEVIAACARPGPEATNVARAVALEARLPGRVPASTVSRDGASGLEAIAEAASRIRSGDVDLVVVAAVESMSRAPLPFREDVRVSPGRKGETHAWLAEAAAAAGMRPRLRDPDSAVSAGILDWSTGKARGEIADDLARAFAVTREEQDAFATESHRRAAAAWERDEFSDEVVPVPLAPNYSRFLDRDTTILADTTAEALANLPPRFVPDHGTVTSGNTAAPADGAVAILVASGRCATELGVVPLARVRAWGFAGCDPSVLGLGTVVAMPRALKRAGIPDLDAVELIEWNECFASEVLAGRRACASRRFCEERLGRGPLGEIGSDRLNVLGGAIAFGHPEGAGAARQVLRIALEMRRRDLGIGLAATSAGMDQGAVIILDRN